MPKIYYWGRIGRNDGLRQQRLFVARITWGDQPRERYSVAYGWHDLEHRRYDFLTVVNHLLVQRDFQWPAIERARHGWASIAEDASSDSFGQWIRDVLLPNLDLNNWQFKTQPNGNQAVEYSHPKEIEQRQQAARQSIEEESAPDISLPLSSNFEGHHTIDEPRLIEMLEFAAAPVDKWNNDDAWLMGGAWTPRCGARRWPYSSLAIGSRPTRFWQAQCRAWMVDACRLVPRQHRLDPSIWTAPGTPSVPRRCPCSGPAIRRIRISGEAWPTSSQHAG